MNISVEKPKRFFIFIGGGIGDVLMTTPMLRALKQHFPDAFIGVSVMGFAQTIILKNNKNVNSIINLGAKEMQGVKGTIKLTKHLRKGKYDYAIWNDIAERRNFFTASYLAGIKNRIGFDRSSATREKTYRYFVKLLTVALPFTLGEKLRTQLNLDILETLGIYNTDLSYDLPMPQKTAGKQLPKPTKTTVGIHAGCDGRAELKRWDLENFIALGKLIQNELNFDVKFYIGPAEKHMVPFLKDDFILAENMPLEDVIEDISNCHYFISNDSGLAHIAAAFSVPAMVLFGPTIALEHVLPTRFLPVHNEELQCRPCFHLRKPCLINKRCLTSITPQFAFQKFKDLIAGKGVYTSLKTSVEKVAV